MPDRFTTSERSDIMRRVRSKNTSIELKIRKELHSRGYRYSLHKRSLPGNPDILMPKHNTAIQVRGCFWHCHGCRRSGIPATNKTYWESKLQRNTIRDHQNDDLLISLGYRLIIVWECSLGSVSKVSQVCNWIEHVIKFGANEQFVFSPDT